VKKFVFIFGSFVLILAVWFLIFSQNLKSTSTDPNTHPKESFPSQTQAPVTSVMAENLEIPWSIVFLPDGSMLLTERPGRVRLIASSGLLQEKPVAIFSNIEAIGEGGLLGITIHPEFATNHYVYLYYTYSENNGETLNRVVRMTYQTGQLLGEQIIVDSIPGAVNHNGGRIKFGPDNYLYITTGDAENPSQAQDINTLGGKILRVTDEGEAVLDNPFENRVYSYGHRNPQGLAWDGSGRLWVTEHGPSGGQPGTGNDEINLTQKGKNYGWPLIKGNESRNGLETPIYTSGPDVTWAPAGAAIVKNSLFFGGLRGETLYEAIINEDNIGLKEHFAGQFGRIRDVVLGPDNLLYITTSNRDGRGQVGVADDKIIRVDPQQL